MRLEDLPPEAREEFERAIAAMHPNVRVIQMASRRVQLAFRIRLLWQRSVMCRLGLHQFIPSRRVEPTGQLVFGSLCLGCGKSDR